MSTSRLLGILAIILQVLNLGLVLVNVIKPQWAVFVAAGIAAIQAFTARVQGSSATVKGE